MAIFEIFTPNDRTYNILLRINNKIEFISSAYHSRIDCLKMVRIIRKKSSLNAAYEIQNLNCGSWCFILKNPSTNEYLGMSETYINREVIESKFKEMQKHAPKAKFN